MLLRTVTLQKKSRWVPLFHEIALLFAITFLDPSWIFQLANHKARGKTEFFFNYIDVSNCLANSSGSIAKEKGEKKKIKMRMKRTLGSSSIIDDASRTL